MPSSSTADEARRQAAGILAHPPFTSSPSSTPRPLAGVLHDLGHWLGDLVLPVWHWLVREIGHPVGHAFSVAFGNLAGLVGLVVAVGIGVALATVLVRRRARLATAPSAGRSAVTDGDDPDALEAEADRLAAEGRWADALRLRFEAGLARLERDGLVSDQRVRTDATLALRLGSPTFTALAERHQRVAYAGDDATADDVDTARRDWPRVPDEARATVRADR